MHSFICMTSEGIEVPSPFSYMKKGERLNHIHLHSLVASQLCAIDVVFLGYVRQRLD